jgi:hypothetical protein
MLGDIEIEKGIMGCLDDSWIKDCVDERLRWALAV